MDIKAIEVKKLRTARGWTQQHLADACAVSLRTVQRVERYGNASQETFMSLCSVFEVDSSQLVDTESKKEIIEIDSTVSFSLAFIILISLLSGGAFGAFFMYWFLR
ncbi:MAG: helix-turn-helix domain-containing protein [Kangiellaceae bacterium]